MKKANWTPDEDRRLRRMVEEHKPIEVMARILGKSEMAVYLYAYRHRIALRHTVKNPLMRNLVEIKFGNVEYFQPTRQFYRNAKALGFLGFRLCATHAGRNDGSGERIPLFCRGGF